MIKKITAVLLCVSLLMPAHIFAMEKGNLGNNNQGNDSIGVGQQNAIIDRAAFNKMVKSIKRQKNKVLAFGLLYLLFTMINGMVNTMATQYTGDINWWPFFCGMGLAIFFVIIMCRADIGVHALAERLESLDQNQVQNDTNSE